MMEQIEFKETSRIAIAAACCIIAAILSLVLFGLFIMVGVDCGPLIMVSILLSVAAFILGVAAAIVITIFRRRLKGYGYSILAIVLSTPFILAVLLGMVVARIRAESEKNNTGTYNLRLLGKELIKYAENHDGYLPIANRWCDLLMAQNNTLTKDNFRFPVPDRFKLKGDIHFAFNKNLSEKRLSDVPGDVVLLFEADGEWNLAGNSDLLKTRYKANSYITMFFVDGSMGDYWYYKNAVRKFDSTGKTMYYEPPRWQP